jgi:putative ABC transport system substrate-binding protein
VLIYGTLEKNPSTQALLEGFRELGYVDGQNLTIDYRYAQGRPEKLPELAEDLVQSKPSVIVAIGGDVTPHVVKATKSIPIIYAMSADPVQLGIAKSLAKPGGNASGVIGGDGWRRIVSRPRYALRQFQLDDPRPAT